MKVSIHKLKQDEMDQALDLVWNVFQEYEAPDYSEEGIHEFYQTIQNPVWRDALQFYGAFMETACIGVIASSNQGSHIALFFVDGKYHCKGIGKKLLETLLKDTDADMITVNSSPYAVPIYHKLGFVDTDREQSVHGLRFVPMRKPLYAT